MIEVLKHEIAGEGTSPSVSPDVSIIIVNWNLKDFLRRCLESVRRFSDGLVVETIVVDNASHDGSVQMIKEEFPEVVLIRNSKNVGFSRANNMAMEVATGRYFFLLNNDTLIFEGSLSSLVKFMDEHPDVGICGPRVINEDGTVQIRSKGCYPSIARALGHFFLPSGWQHCGTRPLGFYEQKDWMDARPMDWVSGCALLARRQAVDSVGFLDAKVFMYCEDVDWCFRMNRAGWKIYYVPSAVVMHYGGQSMKKQTGKVVGAHRAGLVAFYSKYHGSVASVVFRMVLLIGYAMQALGWVGGALFGRRAGLDKIGRMLPWRHVDAG